MVSDEELVRAYLEHYRTNDEALSWAFDELCELVAHAPERAWPVITALVQAATDERTVHYVAAGPLEDILCRHGASIWPRIHLDARSDRHLRHALMGVWGRNRMQPAVWDELQAFLGT